MTIDRPEALRIGREAGPDGPEYLVGRDPREMERSELEGMGHEAMSAQRALRLRCLDCVGGSPQEVRFCTAVGCPSWPFRMGKSPWKERREMTEEQRAEAASRLAKARAARGA